MNQHFSLGIVYLYTLARNEVSLWYHNDTISEKCYRQFSHQLPINSFPRHKRKQSFEEGWKKVKRGKI